MKQEHLLIGEITKPQGIRGEVKVRHYTDDPERFYDLEEALMPAGNGFAPIKVLGARVNGDDVYLQLEGVDDRNEAEKLRGVKLYVDRAHARELPEDEVFIADILGLPAFDTKGNPIGKLTDVLTPGGVDVFVFQTPKGTLMTPGLKDVLLEVNVDEGRIVLNEDRLAEVSLYQ
ncbi:MAG: 16S rRNA processing protein RimM [Clostridiales bacterium]|nr:16S rRNA processing protein RimM [Clostridiales bacterium]